MPVFRLFLISHLIATSSVNLIYGFNVDTRFPLIFSDNKGESYFGFSVALHENRQGKWLLAGAPKGNSSIKIVGIPDAVEPGVIYKCPVNSVSKCQEIEFHAAKDSNNDKWYSQIRDNGWLGVSLDVSSINNPDIVACSHLWKIKTKDKDYNDNYLTNGMCILVNSELSGSFKKLTPLTESDMQAMDDASGNLIYYYGLGLTGMSSHFLQNSNELILGAPGVNDYKGTAIYAYENDFNRGQPREYNIPFLNDKYSTNAYFGYSVSSGIFRSNGRRIVVGAPREGAAGMVYIMEISQLEDEMVETLHKEGTQMGEYFGAAVCAVDVNNDGFAELLVGAPLHSIQMDEGRVYLYINVPSVNIRLDIVEENFVGSSIPRSRFGSAITAIGDINDDNFQDVAIGAPYENDVGAVYIYHGNSLGLHLSQRILASDVDKGLKGFGISISKGKDMDENHFLDLAIGAYESNQAVILRSYPVIQVKTELQTNIEKINLNHLNCSLNNMHTFCFDITACVSYSSTKGPSTIDFVNIISLGVTNRRETRGYFISGGDPTSKIKFDLSVSKSVPSCKDFEVHILNTTVDFLTPVHFNLTTNIEQTPSSKSSFCKDCPLKKNEGENFITKAVPFTTNCGTDDICKSDLQIKSYFLGMHENTGFIIGSARMITLKIEVENQGEAAYETQIIISLPLDVYLSRKPHECNEIDTGNANIVLLCDIANPLKTNSMREVDISIDITQIKPPLSSLSFLVNCTTRSTDINIDDNNIVIDLPLTVEGDIGIIGRTNEEQILFRMAGNQSSYHNTTLVHTFEIFKNGHTPIEAVLVEIGIPYILSEDGEPFLKISSVNPSVGGELNVLNGGCISSNVSRMEFDDQNSNSHSRNIILSCANSNCRYIRCKMGSFIDQETGVISISMNINLNSLKDLTDKHDMVDFVTRGGVIILDDEFNQQPNHMKDFTEVLTQFIKEGTPAAKPVEIWIIVVCALVGILLLGIVVFIMAKCGFFRRKEKEELEKMNTGETLLSANSCSENN